MNMEQICTAARKNKKLPSRHTHQAPNQAAFSLQNRPHNIDVFFKIVAETNPVPS